MVARKMVKIKVDETSGVDHPSHLEEGWIVIKAKGQDMPNENDKPESQDDGTEIEATLAKMNDTMTAEHERMAARVAELEAELAAVKKAAIPAEGDDEALEKSLPAPVRALLKKERDATAVAQTELRKEVDARLDNEFVAKAAAWGSLSINPAEFGPALRQLANVNADLAEIVSKALRSANAQAEAGELFRELGTPMRSDSGDAYTRMTKMAKAKVMSGDSPTIEQAMDEIATANPELVEAYRQEQSN